MRSPTLERRREALAEAGYNTFLLRSEDVYIDLLTDSGTSALSQEQRAAMELGDEAYAGSRSFFRLEAAVREVYGYRHVIPTHQGRGAEHLLARILVRPGQLVPSNLYFTTSRAHVELAGGIWHDVSVPEAHDPEADFPVQGEHRPGRARAGARREPDGVAFVRQEACLNMAGGQPFSVDNLAAVRALAQRVPGALHSRRDPDLRERRLRQGSRAWLRRRAARRIVIREIASLSDGAVFSSKKDHFVPIGGFLALNDDALAERARELVVVYEGFPHYGGMAGHDMEALAQGIRESTDEQIVRHYVDQVAYPRPPARGGGRADRRPGRGPRGLPRREALPAPPLLRRFPAQALAAAIYLAGGVRSMERGIVSGQHGDEPYDGLELVRLTLPRRVYTRGASRLRRRDRRAGLRRPRVVPGLRMTYAPEHLRFFQARFEPLTAKPSRVTVGDDGRLFDELKPPLGADEARIEANRCLECGGAHAPAPCTVACPADVDVPGFVTAIAEGDPAHAAELIFAENLLGGTCARVCPTELLCEGACVLAHEGRRPIEIGRLQRHAADVGLVEPGALRRRVPRDPASALQSSAPGPPAWPAPASSPPSATQ